jgi:cytochrome c biogenesis protein CcmG/thiol:disulfide interchange protein DsbE
VSSDRAQTPSPRKFPLVPVVFGAVAVALVVTIILTFQSGGGGGEAYGTPTVTGDTLPPLGDGTDPAVGMAIPSVSGQDFDGNTVAITNDGRPKMIIMLAHWCPHCQNEVPVVQQWLDAGNLPDGVDIYSVATGTSETRDNYPPSAWLKREGWTVPVIADDPQYTVGVAFGLSAFPFWVFVSADGTVAARSTGEMSPDVISSIAQGLVSGG